MSKSIYLITGPSGAGKTSVSSYLNEHGYHSIDADSTPGLCYFVNKVGKPVPYPVGANASWWLNHNYVWELSRLQRLINSLEPSDKPIFLCGNGGNIGKAKDMFTAIYYLDIPVDLILTRMSGGEDGSNFGQRVEERDQLVRWAEPFKQEMLTLGAIPVDATKPVEKVAQAILAHIKSASA